MPWGKPKKDKGMGGRRGKVVFTCTSCGQTFGSHARMQMHLKVAHQGSKGGRW